MSELIKHQDSFQTDIKYSLVKYEDHSHNKISCNTSLCYVKYHSLKTFTPPSLDIWNAERNSTEKWQKCGLCRQVVSELVWLNECLNDKVTKSEC